MTVPRITGVVLAAGSSSRLGRPKQLLPYRDTTLLGATLAVARSCPFDQIIVTLGGGAARVCADVPLDGLEVVEVEDYGSGCSSSLREALGQVDPQAAGVVLMLGDQPDIPVESVRALIAGATDAAIAVCRYSDGVGHPFWLSRSVFGDLARLHGDKGVWKLIEGGAVPVLEVPVAGPVPLDVDTRDDYERLLESAPQ